MTSKAFSFALAGAAVLGISASAFAGVQSAGSLLVFPCFSNEAGATSIISVTNTNADADNGTVKVEYVYIDGSNCQEFNRTRTLTPNDTLTVLTRYDNPNQVSGYVYVFAKHKTTNAAIKFDWLIGSAIVANANDSLDTEVDPFTFKAGAGLAAGANTDVDGDGIRDLNGNEYEQAPDKILIPNFFADDEEQGVSNSLVLINLTGGSQFTAIVDFLIYNDNEEVFSGQTNVTCWRKASLPSISNAFTNWFLKSTGHNTGEIPGTNDEAVETGWFRINGLIASSTATSINDPAILAMRLTSFVGRPKMGNQGASNGLANDGFGTLPYGEGTQANGDLVLHGVGADATP